MFEAYRRFRERGKQPVTKEYAWFWLVLFPVCAFSFGLLALALIL